jgi:alginate O-acetyltransferase complex protein AlgJ
MSVRPRIHGIAELATGAVFLLGLLLPTLDSLLHLDSTRPPVEKRALAQRPARPRSFAALRAFPASCDAFLGDHFGFRNALLRLHARVTILWLGALVPPQVDVIRGKEDWFFFTGNETLPFLEGRNLFERDQLAAWKRGLTQRGQWLKARGIPYIFVLVPGKGTIYPEHLPDSVRPSLRGTRADQLFAAMENVPEVEMIDLRPTLLAAKNEWPIFSPWDTHWNLIGGYYGYSEIVARLQKHFPCVEKLPVANLRLFWVDGPGGDLAGMLNVVGLVRDRLPFVSQAPPSTVRIEPASEYMTLRPWPKENPPMVSERPGADIERAVVFRDSFAMALIPYLSEHFGRAVYLWTAEFPTEAVENERPNVVIFEIAERLLSVVVPTNPPEIEAGIASVHPAAPAP